MMWLEVVVGDDVGDDQAQNGWNGSWDWQLGETAVELLNRRVS